MKWLIWPPKVSRNISDYGGEISHTSLSGIIPHFFRVINQTFLTYPILGVLNTSNVVWQIKILILKWKPSGFFLSDKKKSQKKKNADKGTQRKQENKKKKLEKEKEWRWPERENGAARNSERNADKSSSRKDEASYDRDYSSDRNNSRSGKERNREKNSLLDSKTDHPKKRKERRPSFSEDEERDRHHKRDSKLHREKKDRSKSRERPHHYPSPREFEENSQYSNQFKEIRKDETRRRHRNASPSRHKWIMTFQYRLAIWTVFLQLATHF